jgi:hypothetical protein
MSYVNGAVARLSYEQRRRVMKQGDVGLLEDPGASS